MSTGKYPSGPLGSGATSCVTSRPVDNLKTGIALSRWLAPRPRVEGPAAARQVPDPTKSPGRSSTWRGIPSRRIRPGTRVSDGVP